jgi:hypothetical protein
MELQVEIDKLCEIVEFKLQKISYNKCKKVFETGSLSQFLAQARLPSVGWLPLHTTPAPLYTNMVIFFHNKNYNFKFSLRHLRNRKSSFRLRKISAGYWIELVVSYAERTSEEIRERIAW